MTSGSSRPWRVPRGCRALCSSGEPSARAWCASRKVQGYQKKRAPNRPRLDAQASTATCEVAVVPEKPNRRLPAPQRDTDSSLPVMVPVRSPGGGMLLAVTAPHPWILRVLQRRRVLHLEEVE